MEIIQDLGHSFKCHSKDYTWSQAVSTLKDQSWEGSSADLRVQRREGGSRPPWILLASKKAICPHTQQQGKAEAEAWLRSPVGSAVKMSEKGREGPGAVPPVPGQCLHTTF